MESLGLIAGDGRLPLEIARAARLQGLRVVGVGFAGITSPGFAEQVDVHRELHLGELEKLLSLLAEQGVRRAAVAGKVSKTHLVAQGSELRLDAAARAALSGLANLEDDSIMTLFADALARVGVVLAPQAELVPELMAPEGVFGAVEPSDAQWADAAFGWQVAKQLGAVDVGQSVVVQDRAVLAVEAIEGTDAAIRRGGQLGRAGATVVKVAKPAQDPRFDLPAVGPGTLDAMLDAGAGLLAVEAGCTLVLERDALVARADEAGIALLGVSPVGVQAGARPGSHGSGQT